MELDNVCVLAFLYVRLVTTGADTLRWLTLAQYLLVVPSKQRTITLGLGVVESDDMVEGRKSRGIRREAATPRGHHKGEELDQHEVSLPCQNVPPLPISPAVLQHCTTLRLTCLTAGRITSF